MICPNCPAKQSVPMILFTYTYSWKDGKPLWCDEYYRCPVCKTEVGTKAIIIHYKESKDDSKSR